MRITNSHHDHNINLTKCTKMTEEEHRIYGMNGVTNSGNAAIKEECPQNSDTYSQGGRLKFFKNGKFILELARAREGEKVAWVPVPKKTFWPPQGSASSVSQYRQESSTSLSVSDDNSSVQSSPWQRDHTWKQTTPQRNASNHMTFLYRGHSKRKDKCVSYHLQRRPYATIPQPSEQSERTKCSIQGIKCNRCVSAHSCPKNVDQCVKPHQSLMQIVQILWNKNSQVMNNITSPRKRILRELERVTIDDLSYKRCRGKVNQVLPVSTAQQPVIDIPETNGSSVEESRATSSKNCSYSITSLLSVKNEKRDDKLSSQFVPVPRMTHQTLKEEPSYDTVDGPRIDIMNATNKRSPVRVVTSADYQPPPSYHPYVPPYMYSPTVLSPGYVSSYYSTYGRGGYIPALPVPLPRPNGALYSWGPTYEQPTRDESISDYVYFETSSTSPYQIRRIEELNKTASGNVEAKVMCFFRRRDLPPALIQLADKHQMANSDESPVSMKLKKWLKTPTSEENANAQQNTFDNTNTGALEETHVTSPGEQSSGSNSDRGGIATGNGGNDSGLNTKQRHQMKHRELFLSRQVETLPATHIRGKCSVTLFNETESLCSYLNKDDMFFYSLVFDPTQKTLLADKGEIRVGSRYQCDITPLLKEGEADLRNLADLESLVWTPEHHLSDRQIDQFLVISRSVGTFARALDCNSSVKQPSLHMSAAAASRDITLFHAMDTLHQHTYDLATALGSLVPLGGPVLCRDEMEEWSASEANLFEEALDKYGKDFNDIRQDFLPWKTLKNIIEYYYMWKTTDRYVQQKRVKAVEAESKLKQVYIPNYNKPNPAALNNNKTIVNGNSNNSTTGEPAVSLGGKACESCQVTVSSQWYAWGPTHMQCRLCQTCWNYWKKYGGLKVPTRVGEGDYETSITSCGIAKRRGTGSDADEDRNSCAAPHRPHRCSIVNCGKEFKLKAHLGRHYATAHGIVVRSGSPRPIMKTRTAFYLRTTPITRASRRLCNHLMKPRHAARSPFFPINIQAVKQECGVQMIGKTVIELKQLLVYNKKERGSVTAIATRLGNPSPIVGQWLILTAKENLPKPEKVAFPKPPKAPDGSLMYERVPNKPEADKLSLNNMSPSLKRRAYEELNGMDGPVTAGPPAKRPTKDPMPQHRPTPDQYAAMMAAAVASGQALPRHISHLNGKPKIAHMTRTSSGRKQVISWMDAPDDVYFRATDGSKKMRRSVSSTELRRAARKPWRALPVKGADDLQVVILD